MSMREEFESWITTTGLDADLSRGNHGCYLSPQTHWLYCAWTNSRAAVEVSLPVIKKSEWACSSDECEYIRQGITMSKHAINAAGIKVKP